MRVPRANSDNGPYVVTDEGRDALDYATTCHCDPVLFGLIIQCQTCGTVFGSVKNEEPRRRAQSWRKR
jgi:hypothetical protein